MIYRSYASVNEFKAFLAGSGYTDAWTQDNHVILSLLEGSSLDLEEVVGWRPWVPRIETKYFNYDKIDPNRVLLEDWLIEVRSVTAYNSILRDESVPVDETDFILEPNNYSPKHTLLLHEFSLSRFYPGRQTIAIEAKWGWQHVIYPISGVSISGVIDDVEIDILVTATEGVSIGDLLQIEDEWVYVRNIDSTSGTLTVVRGVNGSIATGHDNSDIYIVEYPENITVATLELAKIKWRDKDGGISAMSGPLDGAQYTRPDIDATKIKMGISKAFNAHREDGGFFF